MWDYGFHNSVNGDRVYNADQMSGIFNGLITDGVYENVGNKLEVQINSGMSIQIATGRGWFNNRWVNNTTPYVITLEASDVLLNRYAAICVRGDNSTGARTTQPYVKYSEFATTPVKPTMERTNEIKEYCLAYVLIRAAATAITAADIEDTREDSELCGWVRGVITQDASEPKSVTATLNVINWLALQDGYTQTVRVTGMNSTKSVVVSPNAETVNAYNVAGIMASTQGVDSITFTARDLPTTDIYVDILYMGK